MRILVAGSLHHLASEDRARIRSDFENVCSRIGAEIARSEHTLIVGTDSKDCADIYFAQGARSFNTNSKIVLIRAQTGGYRFHSWDNIERIFINKFSWFDARSEQVLHCDAAILIGGSDGTREIYAQTRLIHKPVVPIGYFGGAAQKAIQDLKKNENSNISDYASVADDRVSWADDETPKAIIKQLELEFKTRPIWNRLVDTFQAIISVGKKSSKRILKLVEWLFAIGVGVFFENIIVSRSSTLLDMFGF